MFFSLENKVAVITGGTTGIGLATAKRMIKAGAKVVVASRKGGEAIAEEIGARFIACDVTVEEQVQKLMEETVREFNKIDILVNNAGANFGYNELVDTNIEDFEKNFAVNTKGVVFGIKHAASRLSEGGSIVNVSSAAALQGVPYLAPYVASKWAVLGVTKTATLELGGRNIRCNAICPSSVNTAMANTADGQPQLRMEEKAVPLGRIAEPEEIASLIHFLCADDCTFVNGQAIAVDGGLSAGMSIKAFDTLSGSI